MDDGKEVIAKLPNPNAGRAHFTTASEVATMDYVRSFAIQVILFNAICYLGSGYP